MNNQFKRNTLTYLARTLVVIILAGWLGACASSKTASSKATSPNYNTYDEDLTTVRPKFELPASTVNKPAGTGTVPTPAPETRRPLPMAEPLHINKQLDAVLDTIALKNRSIRYAQGYRIQVYVGDERGAAEQAKRTTYQSFPELNPYLSYRQPTYRLKVGDFMRRMDAERYLSLLRQQFTSAILVPDKIDIRKSLTIK